MHTTTSVPYHGPRRTGIMAAAPTYALVRSPHTTHSIRRIGLDLGVITILFDLDGTLTDPAEGIIGSILHALEMLEVARPEPAALRACIGPPLRGSFARLLNSCDAARIEHAVAHYRDRFATKGIFENKVYDGIPEALEALRAGGARLYVATSKPQVYAERIIAHFGLDRYFEKVYGAALDGSLDDKRELVRIIIEQEGLDPSRTWMVGDRSHDIVAACANGVTGVGVLYGYGTRDELIDAGASLVIETPGELRGLGGDVDSR